MSDEPKYFGETLGRLLREANEELEKLRNELSQASKHRDTAMARLSHAENRMECMEAENKAMRELLAKVLETKNIGQWWDIKNVIKAKLAEKKEGV